MIDSTFNSHTAASKIKLFNSMTIRVEITIGSWSRLHTTISAWRKQKSGLAALIVHSSRKEHVVIALDSRERKRTFRRLNRPNAINRLRGSVVLRRDRVDFVSGKNNGCIQRCWNSRWKRNLFFFVKWSSLTKTYPVEQNKQSALTVKLIRTLVIHLCKPSVKCRRSCV